ncbi:DIE2/ALG10 family-domain-containing protein [Ochromonadaceae sp. CCMP2298]|nr:DIE2/ALG10 family-domain-containing protein [Ochromonadaceae sp. CCMP2298]
MLQQGAVFLTVFCTCYAVLELFSGIDPYMDEVFHAPQAAHYCHGHFHIWNGGITTFPGLYYLSYAVHRALQALGVEASFSVRFLRLINVFMACLLPALYHACRQKVPRNYNVDLTIRLSDYPTIRLSDYRLRGPTVHHLPIHLHPHLHLHCSLSLAAPPTQQGRLAGGCAAVPLPHLSVLLLPVLHRHALHPHTSGHLLPQCV